MSNKPSAIHLFLATQEMALIPALLVGDTDPLKLKRSRCAAGHKAMWHESFGGLPKEDFLLKLDPLLGGLKERLFEETFSCEVQVGTLSEEWAGRLGLPASVAVGAGAFDAHLGALGAEIGLIEEHCSRVRFI